MKLELFQSSVKLLRMPANSHQQNYRGAVMRKSGPQECMEAVFGDRAGRQNSFLTRLEENFNMWEAEVDMEGLSLGQEQEEPDGKEEQEQNDCELGGRGVEAPPAPFLEESRAATGREAETWDLGLGGLHIGRGQLIHLKL